MASHPEFGIETNAAEVAAAFPESIKGKTILITGVSLEGLGYATAEAIASQHPERLILPGRSIKKVQEAVDSLKSKYPEVKYDIFEMDLSSQASVRAAASKINHSTEISSINIVINNAGIMMIPELTLSKEDIELTLATNHIGHFLLTNLIMPKLITASQSSQSPTRVINVSSYGHRYSPVRFSDYNFSKKSLELPEDERPNLAGTKAVFGKDFSNVAYTGVFSYGQSKTAAMLYSVSLNQKLRSKYGISSYTLHPGSIFTELQRHVPKAELDAARAKARETGYAAKMKTREQGSSTTLVAALDPDLAPVDLQENLVKGLYLMDCQVNDAECLDWAKNQDFAQKSWELSEKLVGQKFEF